MNVRRLGVWANLLVSAALALLVWALLVWVASRPGLRSLIDLTPQRVNSVDPVTEELLVALREEGAEVEFHLFRQQISGQARNEAEQQVLAIRGRLLELTKTLLRRYVAIGGENVRSYDHAPFDDTAAYREAAQRFSYTAADNESLVVSVQRVGKEPRFRKLSLVSDLAVIEMPQASQQGPAKRSLVPILEDYEGEKAISSALKGLLVQGNPIAYVVKGYSSTIDLGDSSSLGYGQLIDGLVRNGFEVRELQLRQQGGVPNDASLVLVLEPTRDFVSRDADALYAYMRRGGRLFVNYAWSAIADMNPTGGRLGELLGYELSRQPVFHRIPSPTPGGPSLDGTGEVANLGLMANPLHPTTKRRAESGRPLQFYLARELREREGAPSNVRREALLSTGGQGWLAVPGSDGRPDYRAPGVRLRSFIVAMACEVDVGDEATGEAAPRTGQAVLVSGAFCNNAGMRFYGDFALNVCNWLAERKVLLDIEGARYEVRNLEVKPQQMERVWSLLVLWVPGVFLALGLFVWWRRRH